MEYDDSVGDMEYRHENFSCDILSCKYGCNQVPFHKNWDKPLLKASFRSPLAMNEYMQVGPKRKLIVKYLENKKPKVTK